MDSLTPAERSERMSRIKGKNTKPELIVRSLVHRMGYRYRLHPKELPGRPDLVFASRRKVIFVHGCFWHRHEGCHLARLPKSRLDFWQPKLEANAERDKAVELRLTELGWKVLTIWECEVKEGAALASRVRAFLDDTENNNEGS
ncbi:very short patch repair endonuclease [Paraburkholderia sp. EG304]|uniref:very short patch repair endonuclease n=1 Tax=Paraburkholderia sp. EG304 TaxID=3237015 RepID=UPI003979197D